MAFYKQLLAIDNVHEEKNEIIYLGIIIVFMLTANILLRITTQEQLQQLAQYVTPITIFIFLIHFCIRRKMLKQKFSKYLVHGPIKPHHYKFNFITKSVNSSIFFATELFSISILAMYVFILGYEMGDDSFMKIQVWETMASFAVFPFLGHIMPILLKWDEKHHKKSQEKAGLYYETYY